MPEFVVEDRFCLRLPIPESQLSLGYPSESGDSAGKEERDRGHQPCPDVNSGGGRGLGSLASGLACLWPRGPKAGGGGGWTDSQGWGAVEPGQCPRAHGGVPAAGTGPLWERGDSGPGDAQDGGRRHRVLVPPHRGSESGDTHSLVPPRPKELPDPTSEGGGRQPQT